MKRYMTVKSWNKAVDLVHETMDKEDQEYSVREGSVHCECGETECIIGINKDRIVIVAHLRFMR